MPYKEIEQYFLKHKIPKFRFKQLENAIFQNYITSFDEITNFSKDLRERLKQEFKLTSLFLVNQHKTEDTIKFIFKTEDKNFIETVLMLHNDNRRTVCVSSQIFCSLGCKFCATGANNFKRNLTTKEIIEQVLFINKYLKHKNEKVTNVVYMGMGEPFLNYENVIKSIEILNDNNKFNIGARHITVSTAGIIPEINKFADFKLQCKLAISLHAPNDELRTELMPINKKYPLKELMKACDNFEKKTNKRITYEYVLIKNINDSSKYANELVNLLKNKLCFVNLLIYNPHPFANYESPSKEKVNKFKNILDKNGIKVTIRRSMGDNISGACGQLSAQNKK